MFPDDFDFIDEENIIFTDMSGKCGPAFGTCFAEFAEDGRWVFLFLSVFADLGVDGRVAGGWAF